MKQSELERWINARHGDLWKLMETWSNFRALLWGYNCVFICAECRNSWCKLPYILLNNTVSSGLVWSISGILKDITVTLERGYSSLGGFFFFIYWLWSQTNYYVAMKKKKRKHNWLNTCKNLIELNNFSSIIRPPWPQSSLFTKFEINSSFKPPSHSARRAGVPAHSLRGWRFITDHLWILQMK